MADINAFAVAFAAAFRGIVSDVVREELEACVPRLIAANADAPKGKYITKAEAARLCKTSKKTIEARMNSGEFEYVKQGAGRQARVLILADSVSRYLGNRTRIRGIRNLSRNPFK